MTSPSVLWARRVLTMIIWMCIGVLLPPITEWVAKALREGLIR